MSCFLDLLRCLLCCEDEDETRNVNSFQNRPSYDTSIFQSSSTANGNSFQNRQSYDTSIFQSSSTLYYDHYPNLVSTKSLRKLSQISDEDSKIPLLRSSYSNPSKSVSSSSYLLSSSSKAVTSSSKSVSSSYSNLLSSSSKAVTSSSKFVSSSSSSSNLLSSSSEAVTSSSKPLTPSSNLYSSSIQSLSSSVKPHPHQSFFGSSAKSLQSNTSLCMPTKSTEPHNPSSKATQPSTQPTKFSLSHPVPDSASKKPCPTLKTTLRQAPSNITIEDGKNNYIRVEQDSLPLYIIPEDINDLIKRDIVPRVLNNSVSPLTYKEFFAALLYAEDYYCEKWSGFEVENVQIELHKASIYERPKNHKRKNKAHEKVDKTFVAFPIDSAPDKRPFLLSRDLVKIRPSGTLDEPFQGLINRLEKRVKNSTTNTVLADFRDDFYSQHFRTSKYDISFSFNRVCLKRAHQALNAVSDSLFQNFLFPVCVSWKTNPTGTTVVPILNKVHPQVSSTVHKILNIKGSPPYVIAGSLCVPEQKQYAFSEKPSRTGELVQESVLQIYKSSQKNRILVSAPSNSACDVLMRRLNVVIPKSQMFRVNATFREIEDVPEDILSSSLYKRECFSCPSLTKLKEFRVIFSTFVSSFQLSNEGLSAGYFSHIFLVDASSAIEPEAIIPLANFANENTTVVVTGKPGDCPRWVRSDIARKKGLKISYFERLCECSPYRTLDSKFITELDLHEDM